MEHIIATQQKMHVEQIAKMLIVAMVLRIPASNVMMEIWWVVILVDQHVNPMWLDAVVVGLISEKNAMMEP